MSKRDFIFFVFGVFLVAVGIGAASFEKYAIALIALSLVCTLILTLLLLQRRQSAVIQKRTLEILRAQNAFSSEMKRVPSPHFDKSGVSTKKIIGLLSAQQVSMEILNRKLDKIIKNERDGS